MYIYQVARRTPGLSGASLKNLLNEAAIHAARSEKEIIEWDDVDWAIDRVTVGMEKPNKDALVQDLELVAFHEAGHAVVGGLIPEYDIVTKISIIPRVSGAGGLTFFSPLEDRLDNVITWHYLESQIAVAWGGRVAEELVFGPSKVTTGASGNYFIIYIQCFILFYLMYIGYRNERLNIKTLLSRSHSIIFKSFTQVIYNRSSE
jgi:cell division protease FtsH